MLAVGRDVAEHAAVDGRRRRSGPAGWSPRSARRRTAPAVARHRCSVDPRASLRRRRRCRRGPRVGGPGEHPWARRRSRGRGRTRCRTAGRVRRRWPRRRGRSRHAGGACPSTTRSAARRWSTCRTRCLAPRSTQRGAATARPATAVKEQAGRELEQDLRLGVTAHRAEHGRQLAVARSQRRGQRVRGTPPGPELGRVAGHEAEAEPTVVEVDPGVRLDQPGPEPGRVRLDQATAMPAPSAVQRYVVSPAAAGPGRRRPAGGRSARPARRSPRAVPPRRPPRGARRAGRTAAVAPSISRCAHSGRPDRPGCRPARRAGRRRASGSPASWAGSCGGRRRTPSPQRVDPVGLDAARSARRSRGRRRGRASPPRTRRRRTPSRPPAAIARRAAPRPAAGPGRRGRRLRDDSCEARPGVSSSRPSDADEQRARREAGLGEADGRRQHRRQGEAAEALVQCDPAVDAAGHGDRADVVAERHLGEPVGAHRAASAPQPARPLALSAVDLAVGRGRARTGRRPSRTGGARRRRSRRWRRSPRRRRCRRGRTPPSRPGWPADRPSRPRPGGADRAGGNVVIAATLLAVTSSPTDAACSADSCVGAHRRAAVAGGGGAGDHGRPVLPWVRSGGTAATATNCSTSSTASASRLAGRGDGAALVAARSRCWRPRRRRRRGGLGPDWRVGSVSLATLYAGGIGPCHALRTVHVTALIDVGVGPRRHVDRRGDLIGGRRRARRRCSGVRSCRARGRRAARSGGRS